MISKLFKKLAEQAGINWFNHKEKVERELPVGRINPRLHQHDPEMVYRLAKTYFQKIVVQDNFIWVQKHLIDTFDAEVARWDEIQANHEKELEEKTKDLQTINRHNNEKITALENKIKQLESRRQKIVISGHDINKLIKHLDTINFNSADPNQKMVKKARAIHNTLHGFLQKIKAHAENSETI